MPSLSGSNLSNYAVSFPDTINLALPSSLDLREANLMKVNCGHFVCTSSLALGGNPGVDIQGTLNVTGVTTASDIYADKVVSSNYFEGSLVSTDVTCRGQVKGLSISCMDELDVPRLSHHYHGASTSSYTTYTGDYHIRNSNLSNILSLQSSGAITANGALTCNSNIIQTAGTTTLKALTCSGTINKTGAGTNAVCIGPNASMTSQGSGSISIGYLAGTNTQSTESIAIGQSAGTNTQGYRCVAIGGGAGLGSQGTLSVAIGQSAGGTNQGSNSVCIGNLAGANTQSAYSVALGNYAGNGTQGSGSVAVGSGAGKTSQGGGAVAIGGSAGENSQGSNSVAIGNSAGQTTCNNNSIIINATGSALNSDGASRFYVAPIRSDTVNLGTGFLTYNNTTKEITYSNSDTVLVSGALGIATTSIAPVTKLDVNGNLYCRNVVTCPYLWTGEIDTTVFEGGTGICTSSSFVGTSANLSGSMTCGGDITMSNYSSAKLYPRIYPTSMTSVVSGSTDQYLYFPSWATKVTLIGKNVRWTSGSSQIILQLGDSSLADFGGRWYADYNTVNAAWANAGTCASSYQTSGWFLHPSLQSLSTTLWSFTLSMELTCLESNKQIWYGTLNGMGNNGWIIQCNGYAPAKTAGTVASKVHMILNNSATFHSGQIAVTYE